MQDIPDVTNKLDSIIVHIETMEEHYIERFSFKKKKKKKKKKHTQKNFKIVIQILKSGIKGFDFINTFQRKLIAI